MAAQMTDSTQNLSGASGRSLPEGSLRAVQRSSDVDQRRKAAAKKSREKERRARDAERRRMADHIADQQRRARDKTAEIRALISRQETILASALGAPLVTWDRLRQPVPTTPFEPGPLQETPPAPRRGDYDIPTPGLLTRLFNLTYQRKRDEAIRGFHEATRAHQAAETARQERLRVARSLHEARVAIVTDRVDRYNKGIERARRRYADGEPAVVAWFVARGLELSGCPLGSPEHRRIHYRPDTRLATIEVELPGRAIIPAVTGYRYHKTTDTMAPVRRAAEEMIQRYLDLIAQVSLRVLYDALAADTTDLIGTVSFTGLVSRHAGPMSSYSSGVPILTVTAGRDEVLGLDLSDVRPRDCLREWGATAVTEVVGLPAFWPGSDSDSDADSDSGSDKARRAS